MQAAERRVRGYRSIRNHIAMIYLTVGKLDIHVTHANSEEPESAVARHVSR